MTTKLKWYTRKYLLNTREGSIGGREGQKNTTHTENKQQNGRGKSYSINNYIKCKNYYINANNYIKWVNTQFQGRTGRIKFKKRPNYRLSIGDKHLLNDTNNFRKTEKDLP